MNKVTKENVIKFFDTLNEIDDNSYKYNDKLSAKKNLYSSENELMELLWDSFINGRMEIVKESAFRDTIGDNIEKRMIPFDIEADYIFYKGLTYTIYLNNSITNRRVYYVYLNDDFIINCG